MLNLCIIYQYNMYILHNKVQPIIHKISTCVNLSTNEILQILAQSLNIYEIKRIILINNVFSNELQTVQWQY